MVAIPDSRFTDEQKAIFHKEADVVVDDLTQFNGEKFGIDLDLTNHMVPPLSSSKE